MREETKVYEKIINSTEDLNAMATHLRMSQNFHELKVLAAEWLVPEPDVEDFISGKRFQLAEIPLSEKKYASAAEKLREEMWLLGDQFFADVLVKHLIQKAEENALFGFQVLKKHKSLQKCMNYIMGQAYQIAEKEHEKKFGKEQKGRLKTGGQRENICLGLADTQVYEWAEEYFALADEVKEAKERAVEKKKRLNALKKKEGRGKKAAAVKAEVKSSNETAGGSVKTVEEQKSQDVPVKAEKNLEETVQQMDGKQVSIFDLLEG